MTPARWWDRARHADRRPFLIARNRIAAAVRDHFETQGFVEAPCGALVATPGGETHLHAFATTALAPDGAGRTVYLHTSPELSAKKLLAAGEERLFSLAPVYRNRERGPLHAPEFTMLEWYRAHADYHAGMDDAVALLRLAACTLGARALAWRGRTADVFAEPERLTVADAFAREGVDLLATLAADGTPDRGALVLQAERAGVRCAADDDWSDVFSRVLSARVEPTLGCGRATLLYDYPAPEAALARRRADDPRLAERFELYVAGVELANGFSELNDPAEQRARLHADIAEKQRRYGETIPLDEDFLAALAAMPPACGVALGFDRLVMLAAGATHIDQVIWTPAP